MSWPSKLPGIGTTIFTMMSQRAAEFGAINLGQGFPDYDIDPRLAELVHAAMSGGHNQYAPMPGLLSLRAAIAAKLKRSYGLEFDPERQITVTLGATEAIFSSIQAVIGPGEEAIIFDPAYDSYEPAVTLAGARCVHVPLLPPQFSYDWDRVRKCITARTRLIIVNSPHNPACACFTAADVTALADVVRDREIVVISDEVYEHVIFDQRRHESLLRHEELRERAIVVFSFGKTLHATGLRVGYAVAGAPLTAELRKVHQFNTFSIAHPLQHALAQYLAERPDCGEGLPAFFGAKRDLLAALLSDSGFAPQPCAGSYFQLVDYGAISDKADTQFAQELVQGGGVATIPLSVFYSEPTSVRLLRLCFAKRDETLRQGAERLRRYAGAQRLSGGTA